MALRPKTCRLEIRELERGDFPAVHVCASDPLIARWFSWGPNTESETLWTAGRPVMLLRFVVLCGCAYALTGCHTIDAVRRLTLPSPVTAVSVEPRQDRVRWLAEYRAPPGDLDPILHGIFVRGVTKRGYLDVDPDSTCVASFEGDGTPAEPLLRRQSLLDSRPHAPTRDVPEAGTWGCPRRC